MPIHRGVRLADLISRLPYVAVPVGSTQWYKPFPYKAASVAATGGADIDTMGSWVELVSAASAPTSPFTVTIVNAGDKSSTPGWLEIGTGAAGAEVAVTGCALDFQTWHVQPRPLPIIPGGTRVAVRYTGYVPGGSGGIAYVYGLTCLLPVQRDALNTLLLTHKFSRYYPGKPRICPGYSTTISATAPDTTFTAYSSYVQLWDTTRESNVVVLSFFDLYQDDFTASDNIYKLATGAAGSEVAFGEFPCHVEAGSNSRAPAYELPVPLIIPGSTRVSFAVTTGNTSQARAAYLPTFTAVRAVQPAL